MLSLILSLNRWADAPSNPLRAFIKIIYDFQFEFELVEPPDGKYGSMADDGSWDGMILELMKDVSMCVGSGMGGSYNSSRM